MTARSREGRREGKREVLLDVKGQEGASLSLIFEAIAPWRSRERSLGGEVMDMRVGSFGGRVEGGKKQAGAKGCD